MLRTLPPIEGRALGVTKGWRDRAIRGKKGTRISQRGKKNSERGRARKQPLPSGGAYMSIRGNRPSGAKEKTGAICREERGELSLPKRGGKRYIQKRSVGSFSPWRQRGPSGRRL